MAGNFALLFLHSVFALSLSSHRGFSPVLIRTSFDFSNRFNGFKFNAQRKPLKRSQGAHCALSTGLNRGANERVAANNHYSHSVWG